MQKYLVYLALIDIYLDILYQFRWYRKRSKTIE